MKKLSRIASFVAPLAFLVTPLIAFAQSGINLNAITPYSNGIQSIINGILVPVLMAIAFIVFLWGIYKYFIYGAANESEKAEGRLFAMWGIIGFVVILSLWGIVYLVMTTFGLSVGTAPPFPTIGNMTGVNSVNNQSVFPNAGQTGGTATQSATQSAAKTSLQNQYKDVNTTCAKNGAQSAACQSATGAYVNNLNAYNAAYQSSGSSGSVSATCADPTASNYNPNASNSGNAANNGNTSYGCIYNVSATCADPSASNYNPNAATSATSANNGNTSYGCVYGASNGSETTPSYNGTPAQNYATCMAAGGNTDQQCAAAYDPKIVDYATCMANTNDQTACDNAWGSSSGGTGTYASPALSNCLDTCAGTCNEDTSGNVTCGSSSDTSGTTDTSGGGSDQNFNYDEGI